MNHNDNESPLLVTFSLEGKDTRGLMAKALVSSLTRGLFSGSLMVIKNIETPLFRIGRQQVKEVMVMPSDLESKKKTMHEANPAMFFSLSKYVSPSERQWVIVANSAGLALRNIDHLIHPDSLGPHAHPEVDLYWTTLSHENSVTGSLRNPPGFWAVRGEHLPMVLEKWEEAWSKEQGVRSEEQIWTDVLMKLPLRKRPFEKGEVYAPQIGAVDWEILSNAAFVTVPDWPEKEQWKFLQALYFGTYFGDETGLMLNILDS